MEHGNDDKGELTLEPAAVVRNRRPRALWGVLAALAVATGALVVTSLGDDGTERPGLPVTLGTARSAETAGAADSSMPAWVTYVPGDDLPALGGEARAYRLGGNVSEDRVRALAAALGLDGEVAERDGGWVVTGGTGTLEVFGGTGEQWGYYSGDASVGGGTAGSPGCGEAEDGVVSDCDLTVTTTCLPGTDCADPDVADDLKARCELPSEVPVPEECVPLIESDCVSPEGGIAACDEVDPPDEPEAADLPSEDEARAIALELVAASGFDTGDARVKVEGPADAWYLTVEPLLDGVPSGLVASVAVGGEGVVLSASGQLGPAVELGRYPVLDTRATIERANAQSGSGREATARPAVEDTLPASGTGHDSVAPADDPCPDDPDSPSSCSEGSIPTTTVVAPQCKVQEDGSEICEEAGTPGTICPTVVTGSDPAVGAPDTVECTPPPQPDTTVVPDPPTGPIEVVLVDAEPALIVMPAIDGSEDAYLVPAYRFTDENGGWVDLPAIADDALTTPVTTETTVPDTGVLPDPGGVEPVDPQPCGPPLAEEDASGSTHTVQPDPDCTNELEIGVGYYVDLDFECGGGTFALGGQVWISDDPEVQTWAEAGERYEGGMFTLDAPDHGTFVGDADRTKVAEFRHIGQAEDVFCYPEPRP